MNEQFYDARQGQWNPWRNQHRLLLVDFIKLARTHLSRISVAQENIKRAYALFVEPETIRSAQCNEGIGHIKIIDKPVEDFSQFLDQKLQMPLVILYLRYPVKDELAFIKEQLWMALALIGRYRSICGSATREAAMQRYEIIRKLESLLQSSEDIIQLTQVMFDLARFREQRDMAAIDSTLSAQNRCHSKSTPRSIYEFSSYHKKL